MQHSDQKHLQHTSKTLATYTDIQHVQHPSIYFCNIHMKWLQRASETSETIETYICNIGERGLGRSIPAEGVGAGGEQLRASTTHHQHQH
jgi:hypothetical protein